MNSSFLKLVKIFLLFFKLTCHYEVGRELAADYTPGQVPPLLLTENNIIYLHKYIQVNKIHSVLPSSASLTEHEKHLKCVYFT